jgi:hypothetical protein
MKKINYCLLAMMMLVSAVLSANLDRVAMRKTAQLQSNGITITTNIPDTFYADSSYSIPLTATYTGNGILSWTVIKAPSNMQDVSDTLVWLTLLSNIGNDTIKISVSDGFVSDTLTKPIVVRMKPALAITAVFPDTFYVGSLYTIHLTATYTGSPTLTWTIIRKPSNMEDISNTLLWFPTASNIGNDTIMISVSNDSISDTLSKPIVIEPTGGTRVIAVRSLEPEIFSATVGKENGSINVTIGIPMSSNMKCEFAIYDLSGRTVLKRTISGYGFHTVSLGTRELRSGYYLYRLVNGSTMLTRRVLLK